MPGVPKNMHKFMKQKATGIHEYTESPSGSGIPGGTAAGGWESVWEGAHTHLACRYGLQRASAHRRR